MALKPGPWRWTTDEPVRLLAADGSEICNFGRSDPHDQVAGDEPDEEHRRAIAATSLLYWACKAALPKLIEANGGLTHGIEEEVEMLREAIAFAGTPQG